MYVKTGNVDKLTIDLFQKHAESIHSFRVCKKMAILEIQHKKESDHQIHLLTHFNLRLWQSALLVELQGEPDDRKLIVYLDEEGGAGKSKFKMFYDSVFPRTSFSYVNGTSKHIKFQIGSLPYDPRVIFIDLPRQGFGDKEYSTNYSVMEEVKNGSFSSPKYAGVEKNMAPPHIVIFTNNPLAYDKMSHDKWDRRELTKSDGTWVEKRSKIAKREDFIVNESDTGYKSAEYIWTPVDCCLAMCGVEILAENILDTKLDELTHTDSVQSRV